MAKEPKSIGDDEIEDSSVPSVNRRAGNNKLITFLGFIFIMGAAAALIITANTDKRTVKKKTEEKPEQIVNRLPPLVVPEIPQQVSAPVPQQPPPIPMGKPLTPAYNPPASTQKKEKIIDWRDRKMGGRLLSKAETMTAIRISLKTLNRISQKSKRPAVMMTFRKVLKQLQQIQPPPHYYQIETI